MNKIKIVMLLILLILTACSSNNKNIKITEIKEGAISKNKNGVVMLSGKKLSFNSETIFLFSNKIINYKSFIDNINAYIEEGGNLKGNATGLLIQNDTLLVKKILLDVLLEEFKGNLIRNKDGSFSMNDFNIIITSHSELFLNNNPLGDNHHHNEHDFNDLINKYFVLNPEIKVHIIGTKFNNELFIKKLILYSDNNID